MRIKHKKTWFGRYNITVYVNTLGEDHNNFDQFGRSQSTEFEYLEEWIRKNAPYAKLKPKHYGIRDLMFMEYIFKLKLEDAISFKLEFMS